MNMMDSLRQTESCQMASQCYIFQTYTMMPGYDRPKSDINLPIVDKIPQSFYYSDFTVVALRQFDIDFQYEPKKYNSQFEMR